MIKFCVIVLKHTWTHNLRPQKHTHTDSDEYSIVAFCKNATIITREIKGYEGDNFYKLNNYPELQN